MKKIATSCSVMQYDAACCNALQCGAVSCSVLQCVAVCCSVLHSRNQSRGYFVGQPLQ